MTGGEGALVAVAGFAAGAANAVAGGGSLMSFPALLAACPSALAANATNTVGLVPGYVGGVLGFRSAWADQRERVRAFALDALLGAGLGVTLLLATPKGTFRAVVPWLILASCALLAAQPALGRALARRRGGEHPDRVPVWVHAAVILGGTYGAYFGAALGIVLLALLAIALEPDLGRANALKATITLTVNTAAAVLFAVLAPVQWGPAAIVAVTSSVGGLAGARIALRLPPAAVRWTVFVAGAATAVVLLT